MTETDKSENKLKIKDLSHLFQKYMMYNRKQRTFFQNALDYLKVLKNKENILDSDLEEKKPFAFATTKSELRIVYNRLKVNIDSLINDLKDLVKVLDEGNVELNKIFKTVKVEEIHVLSRFEQLCIDYNNREWTILTSIYSKAPELIKLEEEVFGIQDQINSETSQNFRDAAKNFLRYFANLYLKIQEKGGKENIFVALVQLHEYLSSFVRISGGINSEWSDGLIIAVSKVNDDDDEYFKGYGFEGDKFNKLKENAEQFLRNYFDVGNSKSINADLSKFLTKLNWENSNFGSGKSYSDANDENKLDKFLKELLEQLFHKVEFEKDGETHKKINNYSKEIIKLKDTLGDLKKKWEDDLRKRLQESVQQYMANKKLRFSYEKGFINLIFEKIDGKDISIGEFEELLKDENNLNDISFIINTINNFFIKDKNEKVPVFEKFMKYNATKGVIQDESGNFDFSGNSEDDIDTLKNELKSLYGETVANGMEFDLDYVPDKNKLINNFKSLIYELGKETTEVDDYKKEFDNKTNQLEKTRPNVNFSNLKKLINDNYSEIIDLNENNISNFYSEMKEIFTEIGKIFTQLGIIT